MKPLPSYPVMACLAEVPPTKVQWLWRDRIPLGKLTILAGDPGLGKSFLTVDIAAHVSKGERFPDEASKRRREPGTVLLLSAEDGPGDTIRPRAEAAGADLQRIHVLKAVAEPTAHNTEGKQRPVCLQKDLDNLRVAVKKLGDVRLIVIDPLSAYLGGIDTHRDAEVRTLLHPLAALATEHGVAVVAVTHTNKNQGGKAIYRSIGSIGFVAAARTAWAVVRDPEDDERRLMLPLKNNLAPDSSGMAYRLKTSRGSTTPCVVWEDKPLTDFNVDELLDAKRHVSKVDKGVELLEEMLADGPVPVTKLQQEAESRGIGWRTVEKAKSALGIGKGEKKGFGDKGHWEWSLPGTAKTADNPTGSDAALGERPKRKKRTTKAHGLKFVYQPRTSKQWAARATQSEARPCVVGMAG